jgi:hypothetical protein
VGKVFKVIIAGGRFFEDYELLKRKCSKILLNYEPSQIEIVSGAARGADALGERFAYDNQIAVRRFPADWNAHGNSAGPIRNRQMAEYADALIAFHDGKSRGTANMIETAESLGLVVRTVRY